MHKQFLHPAYRAASALAFFAGIGSTVSVLAADPASQRAPLQLVAASSEPASGAAQSAAAASPADERVETRIKDLHARLGITAAQEGPWNKVVEVMRNNANTMAGLIQARSEKEKTMSAVDDLKSYAEIAEAHADGIEKFAPVFGSLYDSMSEDQKRNADAIFRAHSQKALKHMATKAG